MEGKALIQTLLQATGLAGDSLDMEFGRVLKNSNVSEETLTLEQLREVLASYLQEVLIEAKRSLD
jgi:hypothetical protein